MDGPSGCDLDCLVQPPNSWIAPKWIGERASSLFGRRPGSPENISCSRATPRLHRCKSGVALEQETFSGLPGHPPKRPLAPSAIDLGAIQAIKVATLWRLLGTPLRGKFPRTASRKVACPSDGVTLRHFLNIRIPIRPPPPTSAPIFHLILVVGEVNPY